MNKYAHKTSPEFDDIDAVLAWHRNEIECLTQKLQERDKCSYMGPMRDCPTHGEHKDAARYRWLRSQMFFTKREWGTYAEFPDGMVFCVPITAEAGRQDIAIDAAIDSARHMTDTDARCNAQEKFDRGFRRNENNEGDPL